MYSKDTSVHWCTELSLCSQGFVTRGVRHGLSWRTRFRNPPDFTWISDFRLDFWISCGFLDFNMDLWISGFQRGILDFKVDFYISKWILGFV